MEDKRYTIVAISIVVVIFALIVLIFLSLQHNGAAISDKEVFFNADETMVTESPSLVQPDQLNTAVYNKIASNPAVTPDPVNPGDYILYGNTADCEEDGSCIEEDFSVTYVSEDDYFSVTLYKTPLRETRLQAEAVIKEALEITDPELCDLKYSVGVPFWVDEENSGMNLGFSPCAGSIDL